MMKMAGWRESLALGRAQLGPAYLGRIGSEALAIWLEAGTWYGFLMWFALVVPFDPSPPPSPWIFIAAGAAFGALMAPFAPLHVRIVVERPSENPGTLVEQFRRALIEGGYEPIEVSDTHHRLDRKAVLDLALGPISLIRSKTEIVCYAGESTITMTGPCGVVAQLNKLSEDARTA